MPDRIITEEVVKEEFYKSTEKFHVIASWVGLILNIGWFISDYFIIREYVPSFLAFRLVVSGVSALILVFRHALGVNIYNCMFILVAGISIQNAYMWSVMDVAHFQQHAFAYMVLFIGVGMLVLWELRISIYLAILTIVSNIIFYFLNSSLTMDQFLVNGGLITFSVVIFCIFLIRTRYRLTYNEIKIRLALEKSKKVIEAKHEEVLEQKIEIQKQKDALQEKNREITDSINYARNIQTALLPSEEKFHSFFKDSFVLFKPKDIVSGDFYWVYQNNDYVYYVAADCTGHGVPGGFMTMLGLTFLEQIIAVWEVSDPADVLNMMREKIINALNSSGKTENKDGMDIAVCRLNSKTRELAYAGANNNIYIIKNGTDPDKKELIEIKANRQPCGYYLLNSPFTSNTITLDEGDWVYSFTDGYADQFGGPKGKKFRYKQFESMLLQNSHLSGNQQKAILHSTIDQWRGSHEQVDDILVIGILA
mgnify:CR=1 FL=1